MTHNVKKMLLTNRAWKSPGSLTPVDASGTDLTPTLLPQSGPTVSRSVRFMDDEGMRRECFGIYLKACRNERGFRIGELSKRVMLAPEVMLALEIGAYAPAEIEDEWLDRLAYVLGENVTIFYQILGRPAAPPPVLDPSDLHLDFFRDQLAAPMADLCQEQRLSPHQALGYWIDQTGRDNRLTRRVKLWLEDREAAGHSIGETLILLSGTVLTISGPHIAQDPIDVNQVEDPYLLMCQWLAQSSVAGAQLFPILKKWRDDGVAVGQMLIHWASRSISLEVKPLPILEEFTLSRGLPDDWYVTQQARKRAH